MTKLEKIDLKIKILGLRKPIGEAMEQTKK